MRVVLGLKFLFRASQLLFKRVTWPFEIIHNSSPLISSLTREWEHPAAEPNTSAASYAPTRVKGFTH